MKTFEIDLYEYYKVKKPENGKAVLHGYVLDNNIEINLDRKNPAMLVLPGGGYEFCSFREAEPVCLKFLGYGFKTFWLDYSIKPVKYPYSLMEAVMAMNYIRENADEFMIDSEQVSAVGFSAGGHLCALLGSNYDSEDVKKIFNGKVSAKPNSIILSYPVITSGPKAHEGSFISLCGDDENLKKKLDIVNCVNKNSAPAFIWATYDDACVPVKNSLLVADKYEEVGVPFSLHIFGKGWHGLSVADLTVYGNDEFSKLASKSVNEWVRLAVEWMEDIGTYKLK